MNKYTSPIIEITMFNSTEVIVASSSEITPPYTGGQIELPDHDWL